MRVAQRLSMIAFVLITCVAARAQSGTPNFAALDGIPLDAKESGVTSAMAKFPTPAATPYVGPAPVVYGTPSCDPAEPRCEAMIRRILATNAQIARVAAQTQSYQRLVTPRPLSSAEAFEAAFHPAVASCSGGGGDNGARTYDSRVVGQDRLRSVVVFFTQTSPEHRCETIATRIVASQTVSGSTDEEQHAVEDAFVKAAIAKYGKPTYYSPRHVGPAVNHHIFENGLGALNGSMATTPTTTENRVLPPFVAWCDSGSVADCENGGSTIRRRLSLQVNELNETLAMQFDLEDLAAERRAKAAFVRANVRGDTPQL